MMPPSFELKKGRTCGPDACRQPDQKQLQTLHLCFCELRGFHRGMTTAGSKWPSQCLAMPSTWVIAGFTARSASHATAGRIIMHLLSAYSVQIAKKRRHAKFSSHALRTALLDRRIRSCWLVNSLSHTLSVSMGGHTLEVHVVLHLLLVIDADAFRLSNRARLSMAKAVPIGILKCAYGVLWSPGPVVEPIRRKVCLSSSICAESVRYRQF
jgi:hypothetical protein